jgi:hypothetical protein
MPMLTNEKILFHVAPEMTGKEKIPCRCSASLQKTQAMFLLAGHGWALLKHTRNDVVIVEIHQFLFN